VAAADLLAPPHSERLVRRLRALDEPLIQVWGWPGTGRAALLEALLTAEGERAVALSPGDLRGEGELRSALAAARAHRVRFLVAGACTPEQAVTAAQWLTPGQHLVFAADRRVAAFPGVVVPPQELLLETREVADLWHLLTGSRPDPRAAEGLRAAGDGWYLPLRLALEATGGAGLAGFGGFGGFGDEGEEVLLAVPSVRSFLRHQWLATFSEEEREMLLAAPAEPAGWMRGDGLPAGLSAAWRGLIESRGLWVERAEGEGPPRLLAAYLARQRERRAAPQRSDPPEATAPARRSPRGALDKALEKAREKALQGSPESPASTGSGPVYRLTLLGDPSVRQLAALVSDVVGLDGAPPPLGSSDAPARDPAGADRRLDWRLRRSFQVLAFLASSPGFSARREDVIEAVWPREGEQTIDRNFHPTLSHLRRSLKGERQGCMPSPLLFRAGVYQLSPEIHWEIDLLDFRRRIEEGRAALERGNLDGLGGAVAVWQQAWKLYRGPFLQGHYDAWVSTRRETYHQLYLELLRDLGSLYVRLDRLDEAMDAYRSVLFEDTLQERIHLAVMRLYASQGRRDLIRKQYDKLCTLLLEELGVEPLPETTQEYHRLISSGGG
jgi:DNA-binding SARP family transcriptional activator